MITTVGGAYQIELDDALGAGECDIFSFEADYARKYVLSNYVVNLGAFGLEIDQSKQYQYTKNVVTNAYGYVEDFLGWGSHRTDREKVSGPASRPGAPGRRARRPRGRSRSGFRGAFWDRPGW